MPKPSANLYAGQRAILATQHGKERAIAKPMRAALGLDVVTTQGLDTDRLGTFTGEVARQGSALEACERKARAGMALSNATIGIASEGSFGPHPATPFIPAGIEVMTFVDDARQLVIHESLLCARTNYGHLEVRDIAELDSWLPRVVFPSHALIVRAVEGGPGEIICKGVQSPKALGEAVKVAVDQSTEHKAWVETDMRAHLNPTRMASIRKLAFILARRIASRCPQCDCPGWGRTGSRKGLPCEVCKLPTDFMRAEIFGCAACEYSEERTRSDGLTAASPQYCPFCNP